MPNENKKKSLEECLDLVKNVPRNTGTIQIYLHEMFLIPRFLSLCINLLWLGALTWLAFAVTECWWHGLVYILS